MSGSELVDVLDDCERVVAQATRGEVRRRNLRHRAAYVLVFNAAGQLFVHHRTVVKDLFPGYWDVTIGGVLRAGEGYEEGARRELAEEIGADAVPLRRLFLMRYEDSRNRVAGMVYSCTCDQPLLLQRSEITTGVWMDLDAVLERAQRERFCPDGLEALKLYLSKLDTVRTRP